MRYLLSVDAVLCPVRIHRCEHFLARLRGMLMSGAGCRDEVWYLRPCNAVHTLFQARAIDVAFCDAGGKVLRLCLAMPPRRIAYCRGACCAWEFPAGQAARWQLAPGQRLHCIRVP